MNCQKREVVIKSGRTLYRFTGSYDGQRGLPNKVLRLMEQDNLQKDIDEKDRALKWEYAILYWQTARR